MTTPAVEGFAADHPKAIRARARLAATVIACVLKDNNRRTVGEFTFRFRDPIGISNGKTAALQHDVDTSRTRLASGGINPDQSMELKLSTARRAGETLARRALNRVLLQGWEGDPRRIDLAPAQYVEAVHNVSIDEAGTVGFAVPSNLVNAIERYSRAIGPALNGPETARVAALRSSRDELVAFKADIERAFEEGKKMVSDELMTGTSPEINGSREALNSTGPSLRNIYLFQWEVKRNMKRFLSNALTTTPRELDAEVGATNAVLAHEELAALVQTAEAVVAEIQSAHDAAMDTTLQELGDFPENGAFPDHSQTVREVLTGRSRPDPTFSDILQLAGGGEGRQAARDLEGASHAGVDYGRTIGVDIVLGGPL